MIPMERVTFTSGHWQEQIDVHDFIQQNVASYEGDETFLSPATAATKQLWKQVEELYAQERANGGVLDIDTTTISTITSHPAGYLDRALEKIVGLQTDSPLKRALLPYGGIRMMIDACQAYGYEISPSIVETFTRHRKTHNQGVFDAYTPEMLAARKSAIITGLPDAYGRGRIIGDYRRVALYGVNRLIIAKKSDYAELCKGDSTEETIRQREEISEQIRALYELIELGKIYGFDLTRPAETAQEAIQWLYFGYLAAVKEQNGAAMSLGRVNAFIDIYMERDIQEGLLDETSAQELIDHFIMKLRMVRFLRTPDYNELFSGDPTWVTESIGGMSLNGKPLVTRTSFRMLHTLETLGPAPEPNLTVLWSKSLPQAFKRYCARLSIETSSIQYENDDLMRTVYGDDYGIACCVSPMRLGKQMQFFGARANFVKALLYAINGGRDEVSGVQVGPPISLPPSDELTYDDVMHRLDLILDWLSELYIQTLNVIHYMHDKYAYERIEFALHDREIYRTMACGIAGLSIVADSLSAIKHARVRVIRDALGLATAFETIGEFPVYGNSDERVDSIARDLVHLMIEKLRKQKTYRNAEPTLSVLTITSNVVYGAKTGSSPDGRQMGEPFAPGANPMHGRDQKGALASLFSVAKLNFEDARDGISNTFSIVPRSLGKEPTEQINHLILLIDSYMNAGGHHINVNVLDRELLEDAMEYPERYPQLTVRVSGYAVHFHKLTKKQQREVIQRTFHRTK